MITKILILLTLLMFTSCSILNDNLLDIGDSIDDESIVVYSSTTIFDSYFQFKEAKLIVYRDIRYNIRLNDDKKIYDILTYDSSFKTPDGYKIGDQYYKIKDDTVSSRTYYGLCVFKLESGWHAIFECDYELLNDTTEISWFEKEEDRNDY